MKTFTLEDYKKAIRAKYEEEKNGTYSSFLTDPSRAKLKDLCWEIFKDNTNENDLKSFSIFLGFDFSATSAGSNKLNTVKDKFRPIETFFKGETNLVKREAANMAAILVDFQPRPFLNYSRKRNTSDMNFAVTSNADDKIGVEEKEFLHEEYATEDLEKKDSILSGKSGEMASFVEVKPDKAPLEKWWIYLLIVVGVGGSVFAVKESFFKLKDCMEWREDHYEDVDCESEVLGILNTRIPMDEHQFKLRKLEPAMAKKVYYAKNKSGVWYNKTNNVVEFFDRPGYHPVNHKYLDDATDYMIRKYAK